MQQQQQQHPQQQPQMMVMMKIDGIGTHPVDSCEL